MIAPRAPRTTAIVLAALNVSLCLRGHVLAAGGPWWFWTTNYTHFTLETFGSVLGVAYIFWLEKAKGSVARVPPDPAFLALFPPADAAPCNRTVLRARDRLKPFLLMCQHKAAHREWLPVLRHLDHDRDRKYPEPPTLFDDYSGRGKAERDQHMTIARTITAQDLKLTPPKILTPEQRKDWDAYYEPRNAALRESHIEGKDLFLSHITSGPTTAWSPQRERLVDDQSLPPSSDRQIPSSSC
jgi:hypothetical protein